MPSSEDVLVYFKGYNGVSSTTEEITNNVKGMASTATSTSSGIRGAVDSLSSSLGGTTMAVTSIVGALSGKSLNELIFGGSEKAETNKVLLSGMADSEDAVTSLYDTIDSETNKGLMSMQQVIPALKSFQAETGLSGSALEEVVPQFVQFGSYMYAMTGSSEIATTAMTKLSNGIYGASQYLERFGMSQDVLKKNGWSGQEDDIKGYMAAVQKAMGDTTKFMDTTSGQALLLNKAFSIAGKRIGNELLPIKKQIIGTFLSMNESTGGSLATNILYALSAVSLLSQGLAALGAASVGVKAIFQTFDIAKQALSGISSAISGVGKGAETALLTANTAAIHANSAASLEASATKAGLTASEVGAAAAHAGTIPVLGAETIATETGTAANTGFVASLLPIIAPILAIIAVVAVLVAAFYEIGKAFGWWGNVQEMLASIRTGITRLWNAFTGSSAVKGVISMLQMGFQTLKNIVVDVGKVITTIFGNIFGSAGGGDPVQSLINSFGKLTPIINNISNAFKTVFGGINNFLAAFMVSWSKFAASTEGQALFRGVRQAFDSLRQTGDALKPAFKMLQVAWGQLMSAFNQGGGSNGAINTMTVVKALAYILSGVLYAAILLVKMAITNLATIFTIIAAAVSVGMMALSAFVRVAKLIAPVITMPIKALLQFVGILISLPSKVTQFVTSISQKMSQFSSKVSSTAKQAGKNLLNGIVNTIKTLPNKIWSLLLKVITHLLQFNTKGKVQAIKAGMNILNGVLQFIKQLPNQIANWFTQTLGRILGFVGQALSNARAVGQAALNGVIQFVSQIPQKVYNEFVKIGQKIRDSVSSAVSAATSFGSDIVNAVMGALHIASPGIIQRNIAKEFADIAGRISENGNNSADAASKFGKGIVKGFGKPNLNVSAGVKFNHEKGSAMADYQQHLQNQMKLKTQAVKLAAGGVKAVGGTQITNKHINMGEGSMQIDARNMTAQEAQQVVITAFEEMGKK